MGENSARGPVKEFVVGAAGGITQVLIGQPFDIVKVRMQVQANQTAVQVARNIWKHEGALAFYKGTLPPLLGVGSCISIVYTTYAALTHQIQTHNNGHPLTPLQTYLAGGLAGLANSLISGPTEHIRIRLQTQSLTHLQPPLSTPSSKGGGNPASIKPDGVLATVRKIYSAQEIRGLYRGQTPTLLREFGSYGVWFAVYEGLLEYISTSSSSPTNHCDSSSPAQRDNLPLWKIASCGIATGLVLWTVNYPFDVVKSKMQADGLNTGTGTGDERKYKNLRDVVRVTWRGDGVRGFWRGLGPTLVRAVPVSGGTFVVVEMVRKVI
ncbi:mitochondrial carrier domain-containing protein [Aspergillus karnatakaensis]|uniref:mitochondrial carrier domain-containing protein n=1 Tax=Aspergillus karnatakaensis TaxID=1810916 RepID=UPI003CCD8976